MSVRRLVCLLLTLLMLAAAAFIRYAKAVCSVECFGSSNEKVMFAGNLTFEDLSERLVPERNV